MPRFLDVPAGMSRRRFLSHVAGAAALAAPAAAFPNAVAALRGGRWCGAGVSTLWPCLSACCMTHGVQDGGELSFGHFLGGFPCMRAAGFHSHSCSAA